MAGTRQVSDPNDILDVYFNEASGPTFVNHGTAGTAGNFTVIAGDGTDVHEGTSGGVFGLGVNITAGGNPLIYGPDDTAVPYTSNQINASIFFTPTDFVGDNSHGRIFFKQDLANGVWSSPFTSLTVEFTNSTGDWGAALIISGVRQVQLFTNAGNPIALNKPHMVGMSFDSSGLWTIYLDGFAIGTPQSYPSGTLNLGAGAWTLGGAPTSNTGAPPEQCAALYEELRVTTVSQPAGWWLQAWDLATGQGASLTSDSSLAAPLTAQYVAAASLTSDSSFVASLTAQYVAAASLTADSSISAAHDTGLVFLTTAILANSSISAAHDTGHEFLAATLLGGALFSATAHDQEHLLSSMVSDSSFASGLTRVRAVHPPPPPAPTGPAPLRVVPQPTLPSKLSVTTRRTGV